MKRGIAMMLLWLTLLSPAAVPAAPQFCPPEVQAAGERLLNVGVQYAPPFVMRDDKRGWTGLAIELWQTLSLCLGVRYQFVEYASSAELLGAIERGEADVGVGALAISAGPERRIDFTHAFHQGALGAIVHDGSNASGFLDHLAPFARWEAMLVVIGLILATVVIAYTYWRVEGRKGNNFFADGPAHGFYHAMVWAVQLVFAGRGDPFEVKDRAGQLVVLFLTFFGVTIVSGVTAVITSSLTLQGMDTRIHDVEHLKPRHLAVMVTGPAGEWATRERLFTEKLRSWPQVQRKLDEKSIGAFVHERDVLRYLVKEGYLKDVVVEPLAFKPQAYGLAVPAGSPMRESINASLLAIQADPVWDVLSRKYLGD